MRAAAILGLGCSSRDLRPFKIDNTIEWNLGIPSSPDEADVILLFGGDGTIHRHLGQLVRLGLPVLIVPAGSGNDFARALGFRRVRDSLAAWEKFRRIGSNINSVDLGTISQLTGADDSADPKYFCSVAGVGLDSEVARRANQLPRWLRGHGGYALALLPSIFRFATLPIKITRPPDNLTPNSWSTISDQPTILAAFANSSIYGGGMKIAPHAKMDDGLLDICVIAGIDPFKLFCLFPTVYGGDHVRVREVGYSQAERVRVETEHPLDVYADGEFVCRTPVEIGIEPNALKLVTV